MTARLVSDQKLHLLAHRAAERSDDPGDYWDRASDFLRGLFTRRDISLKEHQWLSELNSKLTEPWE